MVGIGVDFILTHNSKERKTLKLSRRAVVRVRRLERGRVKPKEFRCNTCGAPTRLPSYSQWQAPQRTLFRTRAPQRGRQPKEAQDTRGRS